ncbi:MAG: UDP-3-O-(3-hydroxymyristoyl)glucosamine N-acyltransferase [Phycisphaerales bacterium]|nr:UDP-3-O-(3-hydroxymyristoyl)glucosamine N-acyltransferase [Phycisphaerales bacterium]
MTITLADLAAQINAQVIGDPTQQVSSAATLEEAGPGQISFLSNPRYVPKLATTRATAVVAAMNVNSDNVTLLRTADPYYAFTQAMVILHGHRRHPHAGIHPDAHVDPTATVGEGTILYPGVFIGPNARIGRDCILYPNVVIYDQCILGDRVTIHGGSVIGQDGFGYATHKGIHHKIPQVGNVIIEDDVEIGANCAIERATLGSTIIGKGTKFCDLIAIGHGTKIGAHCLFVAQVGIAGSVTVGHHVTMAGQVGVSGHLKIGDKVTIGAQAGVINNLDDQSTVMGAPAMPVSLGRRVYTLFTQLPDLADRIKKLEQKMSEIATDEDS